MTELFRDDTINIAHEEGEAWLHVDWTGYQTVGSVKAGCERILALMVGRGLAAVLNDNTHVVGIWSGASEWGAVDWFPRMKAAGLRAFAWVYSPSRFSQVSTDATLALLPEGSVNVRMFDAVGEARAWLERGGV
jgi:hypothetical protein